MSEGFNRYPWLKTSSAEQGRAVPVSTAILIRKIDGCIEDPMWADLAEISKRTLREIRAALTTQPQAEPAADRALLIELCARIESEDWLGTCGSRQEADRLEAEHNALLARIDAALATTPKEPT